MTKNHSNRKAHNWFIYDGYEQFMQANTSLFSGVLYDLGAGESPYMDYFLQNATSYAAVDWAGSYHNTNADISADLNNSSFGVQNREKQR